VRTANTHRQRQIINIAAQLFAEHPYHEVRMDDVAVRAGVSKGTLYAYFKDKEDLYLALIRYGLDRLFARIEDGFAHVKEPEDKVLAFARESLRFFDRHFHWLELIQRAEVLHTDSGGSPVRESRDKLHELIRGVMDDLHATGRFVVDDPVLATLALIGMTREIVRFLPRPWPVGLAGWIARQFLDGIRRRPGAMSGSKTKPARRE